MEVEDAGELRRGERSELAHHPHDQPLHLIVTPEEAIEVASPPPAPPGIDWNLLAEQDLQQMPILKELRSAIERRS